MIDEQTIELLIERLIQRVEKSNEAILKNMGQIIKKLKSLTPTEAHKLVQILKYGGNYDEMVRQIAQYSELNIKDVDEIFSQYAIKDQNFYEKFYQYRNIPFVPFNENYALKTQTMALANIVKNEMYDYFRTNVLGYTLRDEKGNLIFKGLRDTYNELLDTALLNVGQGKETFDQAMSGILKEIGTSGLKTINYESGRNVRLDSAARMHLQSKLRELHNENQELYGKEFGADGVEISVHSYPAPDHEKVQGRQFSKKEFEKLQSGNIALDYKGKAYTLDHDGKNGYRPISEMNCYHYIFNIVLGVSEPSYTDKELLQIRERNDKGFMLYDKRSGKYKKYTMYEGTQLQRNLERKIREQKDIQILAKESGNDALVLESQSNITQLTTQYKELSEKSGLPTKMDRLKVAGYKRVSIKTETLNESISDILSKYNIKVDNSLFEDDINKELTDRTLNQLDYLVNEYPVLKNKIKEDGLTIETNYTEYAGDVNVLGDKITLSKGLYKDKDKFINLIKEGQDDNWSAKVNEKNYDIYTITHETGHIIEDAIIKQRIKSREGFDIDELMWNNDYYAMKYKHQEDVDIFNEIFLPVSEKTGMNWEELYSKYVSDYGRSENWFEWFAELFTKMELGEEDIMTIRLKEYLGGELWKK